MIVLGAPEDDEHAVPCAILADLLRAARFEVHDLGADTPTASFPVAADHAERLVGVMIGVTTEGGDDAAAAAFAALRHAGVTVPLFVGGAAITDADHARRLGADHWTGPDGRTAVMVVERVLYARPSPTSSPSAKPSGATHPGRRPGHPRAGRGHTLAGSGGRIRKGVRNHGATGSGVDTNLELTPILGHLILGSDQGREAPIGSSSE